MKGKNVLVLGLGRREGGVGVARWAAEAGANVTVTDRDSEQELSASIEALSGLPIRFVLGGHDPADVDWADLVVRNPAVPNDSWVLERAREQETPVAMEMALFLEASPAPVVGITGSKGKTTTSYATHHLLSGSFPRAELVGNMGISALDHAGLPETAIAVAEMSSFQAEGMAEVGIAPEVCLVTNLMEDHLDRYPDRDSYHRAKAALFDHQETDDWAILPSRDFDRERLDPRVRGQRAYFQSAGTPLPPRADGVFVEGSTLRARWGDQIDDLVDVGDLPIRGDHYVSNVAAASCAALAVGVAAADIRDRLGSLPLLHDRQELVAEVDGVEYVNDTTATMPGATAASVSAYTDQELILIAGGASKGLDPDPLGSAIAKGVKTVVLLQGTATAGIEEAIRSSGFASFLGPFGSMQLAVSAARSAAQPGAVVLLAPGAASFGMFTDEFDRGAKFRDAVWGLAR